jgi:hypothetical protein
MLGSVSERMMRIGLPHVDAWNVWWSEYGNDAERFAAVRARVEDAIEQAGRAPGEVEATAAVLVQLPGGAGRLMGETYDDRIARRVLVSDLAEHLRAMADAGAAHVQLVLDPITVESIEAVGEAVRDSRTAESAQPAVDADVHNRELKVGDDPSANLPPEPQVVGWRKSFGSEHGVSQVVGAFPRAKRQLLIVFGAKTEAEIHAELIEELR